MKNNNKTIILCGSKRFKDEILATGELLRGKNYNVIVPKEFLTQMSKSEASRLHFKNIINTDCVVLIVNEGADNYIGPNTFAEIAMAFYYNRPIYLKNNLYELYQEELVGWGVKCLNGDLDKLEV